MQNNVQCHRVNIALLQERSIQFNSKTLNIPQGAILLWSCRARKTQKQKTKTKNSHIKLREQYDKHNTTNKESYLTIVEL